MRVFVIVFALFCASAVQYSLKDNYSGESFFDTFDFLSSGPGTGKFVDKQTALAKGYAKAGSNVAYMGVNTIDKATNGSREGLFIRTQKEYQSGLFVLEFEHMPAGCGVWPAWWLYGPDWPNQGEIDIIEGINLRDFDQSTLHSGPGCDMKNDDKSKYTGTMVGNECRSNHTYNHGCGITGTPGLYGAEVNQKGGAVYACEWTSSHVQMWSWQKSDVPKDIVGDDPNPESWGKPYAYFPLGANCSPDHFKNQRIALDTYFCGWAGDEFQGCTQHGTCVDWVDNNPGQFVEAYWAINYLKVYQ